MVIDNVTEMGAIERFFVNEGTESRANADKRIIIAIFVVVSALTLSSVTVELM